MNLIEGIQQECHRVRELIPHYDALGPVGTFGGLVLRESIREGEAAIASGDVTRMVEALKDLKECE